MKIDVFVPASTGETTKFKHYEELNSKMKVSNKVLLPLNDKPMISYVIEALDGSKYVNSITIVGKEMEELGLETTKPLYFIDGGKSSFDSLNAGVTHFQTIENRGEYMMNVSSDIPLINSEMVDAMVEGIDFARDLELYLGITTEPMTRKYYPEAIKVPIKLRETNIFVGDIHIFKPTVLDGRRDGLRQLMSNRKSVLGVIKVVSLRYIFKYILRRLTVNDICKRFKKLFDLDAAFVLTEFPEPCMDLDYAKDIDLFSNWIKTPVDRPINASMVHTVQSSEELKEIVSNQKTEGVLEPNLTA